MKISGFTIVRNAIQYDFPVIESIRSALPIVDEFIVALGDSSDDTEALINSIGSDKIKIIKSDWDTSKYNKDGQVYAHQTDIAYQACSGDWCFYLQADEVLHEKGLDIIKDACKKYVSDQKIDGFLLNYIWFFGSYDKYIDALHIAYPKEVRIIRKNKEIHSWRDAQSFRWMPDFNYENYWQKENTKKLNCIDLNAWLFHYSWSRDPRCLVAKKAEQNHMHWGSEIKIEEPYYEFGNIATLPDFKGTHPSVMSQRIGNMNWSHLLKYTGEKPKELVRKFKLKYRILSFFENRILGGRLIFGFKIITKSESMAGIKLAAKFLSNNLVMKIWFR